MTMLALASELGISFDSVLVNPTFNRHLTRANSSFDVEGEGVINAPPDRGKSLTKDERRLVHENCSESYNSVLGCSLGVKGSVWHDKGT